MWSALRSLGVGVQWATTSWVLGGCSFSSIIHTHKQPSTLNLVILWSDLGGSSDTLQFQTFHSRVGSSLSRVALMTNVGALFELFIINSLLLRVDSRRCSILELISHLSWTSRWHHSREEVVASCCRYSFHVVEVPGLFSLISQQYPSTMTRHFLAYCCPIRTLESLGKSHPAPPLLWAPGPIARSILPFLHLLAPRFFSEPINHCSFEKTTREHACPRYIISSTFRQFHSLARGFWGLRNRPMLTPLPVFPTFPVLLRCIRLMGKFVRGSFQFFLDLYSIGGRPKVSPVIQKKGSYELR